MFVLSHSICGHCCSSRDVLSVSSLCVCSLTCFYCKVFFNRRTCGQVLSVLSTWSQLSIASVQCVHACGWHVAQGRMYGAVECELYSGTCFVSGMLGFKPSPSGIYISLFRDVCPLYVQLDFPVLVQFVISHHSCVFRCCLSCE